MRRQVVVALLVAVCLAGGCGASVRVGSSGRADVATRATPDPAGPITVASFDFTESRIVAEIYAQALESDGHEVERVLGVASRELVEPALEQGLVDLVPEYAGTALQFLTQDPRAPSADPTTTHERLRAAFDARGIVVLDAAPAQSQNALVVRRELAAANGLRTVSDLRPLASRLVLGGPPECPDRPLCLIGFRQVYGLRFGDFVPLDVGGPLTLAALEGGEIDVAVLFTGDASATRRDLTFLADDRGLQPAENITPVVRRDVLRAYGSALTARINAVSRRLTTSALSQLTRQADVDDTGPARLAAQWLVDHRLPD